MEYFYYFTGFSTDTAVYLGAFASLADAVAYAETLAYTGDIDHTGNAWHGFDHVGKVST